MSKKKKTKDITKCILCKKKVKSPKYDWQTDDEVGFICQLCFFPKNKY